MCVQALKDIQVNPHRREKHSILAAELWNSGPNASSIVPQMPHPRAQSGHIERNIHQGLLGRVRQRSSMRTRAVEALEVTPLTDECAFFNSSGSEVNNPYFLGHPFSLSLSVGGGDPVIRHGTFKAHLRGERDATELTVREETDRVATKDGAV